jgi:hypothetical protein
MTEGPCHFCSRTGALRAKPGEDQVEEEVYVCQGCWDLLRDPATALPLIRGDLSITLKGTVPDAQLSKSLNSFMERLSKFRRPG